MEKIQHTLFMTINKFGAMTLLSITALSLGLGAFVSRAHAEIGLRTGADGKVDLGYGDDNRDGDHEDDNDDNDNDRHDNDKRGGDTSDGRMYKGDDARSTADLEIEDRMEKDNGNHYGFFMRFGNFFKHFFRARSHAIVSSNLNNHTYRLTSYNGATIASDQNYTLVFNDGKISAKFCNTMNGSYSLKSGVVSASLMSTLMACSDANLMTMESSFGAALQEGVTITGDKDTLTLKSKTGTTFVFAKQ